MTLETTIEIIARPRGCGKTTELIKISARTGDYIISPCRSTVIRTMEMAEKMELKIPKPFTYEEFLSESWRGLDINGFLIDDLDLLLYRLLELSKPIHAISISAFTPYDKVPQERPVKTI